MTTTWNDRIASLPGAHILQTSQWGQVKARIGWKNIEHPWTDLHGNTNAAALILQRSLPVGGFARRMRVLYVPKGPLLNWEDPRLRHQVLADLEQLSRKQGAIFIKIDPDIPIGYGEPGSTDASTNPLGQTIIGELQSRGWRFSQDQIQFRNTVQIDLTASEEEILTRMKQKTRYNIRLAERKGVHIRAGTTADLEPLYRLYAETSIRDGFVIRDREYYLFVWNLFIANGLAEPLVAEIDNEIVAGIFVFRFAKGAWYLFGMSSQNHRDKMPNYLLQWEAIRRSKSSGCALYDLWGAPDQFTESDSMWGVYRFKEGLGGRVVRHIGAWDFPTSPLLYRLYTQALPRLLAVMRRRGKERTQRLVGV